MSFISKLDVKPNQISQESLDALNAVLNSEVPTPLISDPYCFEPCGHLLCEERTNQVANRVLPFPLSCIPDQCPKCNVEVVRLIPDATTRSVITALQETLLQFKICKQKRTNPPVDVTLLFLMTLQIHNPTLLNPCGHVVSTHALARKKACSLCGEKPNQAFPHPALSKISTAMIRHIFQPILSTACSDHILNFRFAEALNIIEFLTNSGHPSEDLIKSAIQKLLQFPDGIALHAATSLFLKLSITQQSHFKDQICEKLRASSNSAAAYRLPEQYSMIIKLLSTSLFPKLTPEEIALIHFFDNDKSLKTYDTKESLLLWRWGAFLLYSRDHDLQMSGISIVSDAFLAPLILENCTQITLKITQRIVTMCERQPELWELATAIIRKNFPKAISELRDDIKVILNNTRVANKDDDGISSNT